MVDKKIVFIGGKGGVGKSTTSAALAWQMSTEKKKTLLVSTDPAHNTGHIFHKKIGPTKTKINDYLYAIEIDPAYETKKYIETVKENIKGVVKPTMMEEVHRQLDTAQASPGADEAALFDRLISIMIEEGEAFEKVIFDTAPTGHTIRLLSLPEIMGIWIQGLLEKRHKTRENYSRLLHDGEPIEDPIFDVLQERQAKFKRAREIMLNGDETAFMFVLNPEKLSIIETDNAIQLLKKYDLVVSTLIVNRVLPDVEDGKFFQQRKKHERQYLQQIEEKFTREKIMYVPFFPHDMHDLTHLEQFASYLQ